MRTAIPNFSVPLLTSIFCDAKEEADEFYAARAPKGFPTTLET